MADMCCSGVLKIRNTINKKNLNIACEQENKLDHDDSWLCAACLLLDIVGIIAL